MNTITTHELATLIQKGIPEDTVLLDVREPFEWKEGIIEGSRCMSLSLLPLHLEDLDPATQYILICRSGNRSAQAGYFLESRGYLRVANYEDGMLGWREEELPIFIP